MTSKNELLSFSLAFALVATSRAAEPVTYEMFGAKGDGKTDDRAAIVATHKAAIEGFEIDDSDCKNKNYKGPYLFGDFNKDMKDDTYVENFPYKTTEEAVVKNVKVASGRSLQLSPNLYMFRNVKVESDQSLRQ